MGVTVTRTKILVPKRRPDLLSRSRLISMLDDVLDYPYTLLSAPAGYGKTSLMIDLAHQASYPICWYSIDPLDIDPNRFLTHFIHAIQIQFPDFGGAALSLIDDQANPLQDPAQAVSILVNEIYQKISEHYVLFLDDFHHLTTDPGITSFISRFGQEMDDNTHLVMASRTLFDFPDLPLLIGRRMVKGIGFDELAFQHGEIKSFYREILQRDITHEEIENLLERTEGWITGLVFSVDTDLAHLPGPGKTGRITGADLFQYLAEQVLERQTPPVQDFLLRTSLFDEFNTDLCNLVLGDSKTESWAEMIGVLQQENLFVQQVDDENSWIRYHSLFKDFLRVRFHDLHPEEEEKIYSRLITIYRESESWEKAFATAMQIGNPDLMAEVIDQAHSTLVHQGRMQLLHSWLELLPEEGFKSFPILYILRGICYTAIGNPKKGLSYISNIINKSSIASDQYLFTRALLCRTTTSRMLGRYDDALFDINLIFKDHLSKNIDETLLAETYREAGLAYLNIGNYSKSKDYFVQSINSYIELDNINNQALVHQDLGLLLMEHGNFHGASSHFDIAIKTWASQNNTSRKSNILNNKGTLSVLTGNYRKSAELLHKAISNSEVSSDLRMLAFAIASQGDLAKSLSLYEIGLDRYDKANKISEEILEGYLLYYLAINKSSLYRLMGRCDKAKELIQVARTFILQGSSQNEIGMWHLEKGFLHLAQNEYRSSRESFLQAEKTFRITEKPIELAKARMGLVLASYELDKPRTTQDHIKDWIACLIKLETNQPLLPELHFHGEIIEAALEKSLPNPALDTLLADLVIYRKRLPRLQKEIFPEQEQDPLRDDKLEIFALGRNQVFIRGEKITSPEWIYQKTVRELFFYLLTLPRGATKEQIGLVFWPDSSPSQLTCQFKNAIYRMRRAIGREAIIYDPETRTYSFNLDQPYTYDVEKFLSLLQKAENEPRVADRIKYYQEAVGLYDHPYSPQAGGVWAEPIRQSLSRKHEQALLTIAEHQLAKNQHQTCLKYCQIVLDIEPCQEKAFHLSLRACAKANDRTSLIRYYEEYKKNLLEHLNIKPSKSTTRLFKELLG